MENNNHRKFDEEMERYLHTKTVANKNDLTKLQTRLNSRTEKLKNKLGSFKFFNKLATICVILVVSIFGMMFSPFFAEATGTNKDDIFYRDDQRSYHVETRITAEQFNAKFNVNIKTFNFLEATKFGKVGALVDDQNHNMWYGYYQQYVGLGGKHLRFLKVMAILGDAEEYVRNKADKERKTLMYGDLRIIQYVYKEAAVEQVSNIIFRLGSINYLIEAGFVGNPHDEAEVMKVLDVLFGKDTETPYVPPIEPDIDEPFPGDEL